MEWAVLRRIILPPTTIGWPFWTSQENSERSPPVACCLARPGESLWCHMDQRTGIRVFQQPQRTIWTFGYVANAFADLPTLSSLGAAFAVEQDASQRHTCHSADEGAAIPLRERLGTAVEHQIAG